MFDGYALSQIVIIKSPTLQIPNLQISKSSNLQISKSPNLQIAHTTKIENSYNKMILKF